MSTKLKKLRSFVVEMTGLVQQNQSEPDLMAAARSLLQDLVAQDDWLPAQFGEPDVAKYRQYLLHCDPLQRFSVVSFVWGPARRFRSTTILYGV